MKILSLCIVSALIQFCLMPQGVSHAATLTNDTVWEGEIKATEDVLIPKGVTLTVKPGTHVKFASSESTKTDPEYLSPFTEITIRGKLVIEGNDNAPVVFSGDENKVASWAGIILDEGALVASHLLVKNAETALHVINGTLKIYKAELIDNRYALVVQGPNADSTVDNSRITGNDYGVLTYQGGRLYEKNTAVFGNRKKDRYSAITKEYDSGLQIAQLPEGVVSRSYKDEVLLGNVVWQGRIEVAGLIRVPQGSRLIIMPGTIVEFSKRDTDKNGIGENGILVQGRLVAKGSKELPIVFRSAEKIKRSGDWDSINIMDSAGTQNLLEYCLIENAYRGLHFHFSNVAVHDSVIRNSYRAVQFQESMVDLTGNHFVDNKSGVQGRDSDVILRGNVIQSNYIGGNLFRTTLTARDNRIVGNLREGLRVREGVSSLRGNLIDGNRHGVMLADMYYGSYGMNIISNNSETGLSLKNADNVEVAGNVFTGNGFNGLSIQDSRAVIRNNQITDNGESGVGVLSFGGLITENNFAANGLYALDLDGTGDIDAPSNWWGNEDPTKVILDSKSDSSKGHVRYEKAHTSAVSFVWPLQNLSTDTVWRGRVVIGSNTTVLKGAELRIAPKTEVAFSQGTGLLIKGRMKATGKPDEKIVFTSIAKKGPSEWNEIQLEYATGSVISNCVFEYATWGLHSHFTNLSISGSIFKNNYGGMRFRSGPVELHHSKFENNSIGIRAYLGNAVITENDITNNEVGIFVREKGGGLTISRNNIFQNSNYNIRVGDFNNEDIPATDNWWGGDDPLSTMFDGRNEPGIGNVLFEPFSLRRFTTEAGKIR